MAVDFDDCSIAFLVSSAVKGEKEESRRWFFFSFLKTCRVSGFVLWTETDVNCRQNLVAMAWGFERLLSPKLIGWFGGWWGRFPDKIRRSLQNLSGFSWGLLDSTFSCHCFLDSLEIDSEICMFSRGFSGSWGSTSRRWSRSLVRSTASLDRPGLKSFLYPAGMWCLEALIRIFRNCFSPVEQDVGGCLQAKEDSVSDQKRPHLARLKLT